MCEYCRHHGVGDKKWYLTPKNFDLWKAWREDPEFQRVMDATFSLAFGEAMMGRFNILDACFDSLHPSSEMKESLNEFNRQSSIIGQILPVEDALKVLEIPQEFDVKIGLTICECRKLWGGFDEMVCMHFQPVCDLIAEKYLPGSKAKSAASGKAGGGILMSKFNLFVGLTWIVTGLSFIAISIPLLKRKIKMNRWYGFRFPKKSFESPENWYKINRYGAQRLILWSAVLMLLGCLLPFLPPFEKNPISLIAVLHVPLIVVIAAIESWLYARKL